MRQIASATRVRISLDGRPLDGADAAALSTLRVHQRLSRPAQAVVAFAVLPRPTASLAAARPGSRLTIAVNTSPDTLFEGEVTAVEHAYLPDRNGELRLRAYDPLHRLRLRQQVRSFDDLALDELARALVGDLGLGVEAPSTAVVPRRHQHRQTDLELLRQAAEDAGLHVVVEAGSVRFVDQGGDGDPVVLVLGANLLEATLELNAAASLTDVEAHGWTATDARTLSATAGDRRARATAAASGDAASVGGSGRRILVDQVAGNDEHLAGRAQAALDVRVGAEVVANVVADGHPGLRPGRRMELRGVDPGFAGIYVITETTHTIDSSGYQTAVSTEPPPGLPPPTGAEVTVGVVSDVDDPERRGRVCVRLPAIADAVTVWAPVVLPGFGDGKGLIALPDVGDTVAVLLAHGDPAQPVVLGGFAPSRPPGDLGVDGGSTTRFRFETASGQALVLDGSGRRTTRLETDNGSHLELGPNVVRLAARSDLVIEAPGRNITIRAAAIDFEEAT